MYRIQTASWCGFTSTHLKDSVQSQVRICYGDDLFYLSYIIIIFIFFILVVLETALSCAAGDLGLPDEFSARVDIEVDNPGPSRVIQSVALRARSGTARVHAPKDLQVRGCSLSKFDPPLSCFIWWYNIFAVSWLICL